MSFNVNKKEKCIMTHIIKNIPMNNRNYVKKVLSCMPVNKKNQNGVVNGILKDMNGIAQINQPLTAKASQNEVLTSEQVKALRAQFFCWF